MIAGTPPRQDLGDILASSISHGLGILLALAGAVMLICASTRGNARCIASCSIYSGSLLMLYISSTLYHSLIRTKARHVLRVLDHSAIYLLIAATYTPFALISLHGPLGWFVFGFIWFLAVAGVVFKSLFVDRFAVASALIYIVMGWLAILIIEPLARAITWRGMMWLAAGGVAYTLGMLFFAKDRLRYFHALWHVFVLAGSIIHYFAIFIYVVPGHVK